MLRTCLVVLVLCLCSIKQTQAQKTSLGVKVNTEMVRFGGSRIHYYFLQNEYALNMVTNHLIHEIGMGSFQVTNSNRSFSMRLAYTLSWKVIKGALAPTLGVGFHNNLFWQNYTSSSL